MRYPHPIRLRGPWEFEVLSATGDRPAVSNGRIHWPLDLSDALGADFHGRIRFRRNFNLPTGLEPHEAVWLVVAGCGARGEISLNGRPLGSLETAAPFASLEVTERLESRNELWLDVEIIATDSLGSSVDVRLEIRTKE